MSGAKLQRLLERELGYTVKRIEGSHQTLVAPGRPPLHLAYHSGRTFAPGLVRKILVKDVGLTEEEAFNLVS